MTALPPSLPQLLVDEAVKAALLAVVNVASLPRVVPLPFAPTARK